MMSHRDPEDAYFDAQFEAIQVRIAAEQRKHHVRRRWAIPVSGTAVALALTGGAIMVVQATQAGKSVSTCYESASLSSSTAEVGTSNDDGTVSAAETIEARVGLAESQCDALWRIGAFSASGPSDGKEIAAPPLFTCVLRDGRLGVFPVTEGIDCTTLNLRDP